MISSNIFSGPFSLLLLKPLWWKCLVLSQRSLRLSSVFFILLSLFFFFFLMRVATLISGSLSLSLFFFFCIFFFFFATQAECGNSWAWDWTYTAQQQPEPQRWECRSLNPLGHQRTPSLFFSVAVISTTLTSTSIICSSASVNLLLVPSRLFFISAIVLFTLLFKSSSFLLNIFLSSPSVSPFFFPKFLDHLYDHHSVENIELFMEWMGSMLRVRRSGLNTSEPIMYQLYQPCELEQSNEI